MTAGHLRHRKGSNVPLTPKGSPFDAGVKSSGVRQSKIYKSLLGSKGLSGLMKKKTYELFVRQTKLTIISRSQY